MVDQAEGWDVAVSRQNERQRLLAGRASDLAAVALANIIREYPNVVRHVMSGPEDRLWPRDIHPAFYGSFDWHSCVEMHWLLGRLLRSAPQHVPQERTRAALGRHLSAEPGAPGAAGVSGPGQRSHVSAEPLAAEAAYVSERDQRIFERPYGWGWALWLVNGTATWDDVDARRWTAILEPLADVLTDSYLQWLPKATYPVRYGV